MKIEKRSGVWCQTGPPYHSAGRIIAERAMVALDMDPNDFRQRDPLIMGISDVVTMLMDEAEKTGRKRARKKAPTK